MTRFEDIVQPPFDGELESLGLSMLCYDISKLDLLDELCFYTQEARKIFIAMKKIKSTQFQVLSVESGVHQDIVIESISKMVGGSNCDYIVTQLHKYKHARILIAGIQKLDAQARGLEIDMARQTIKKLEELMQDINTDKTTEDYALEYFEDIDKKRKDITTGYSALDKYLSLTGGDLVVIAGRTSMGKTACMLNMALRESKELNVGFISLEMTVGQLLDRMICIVSGITSYEIKEKLDKVDKISNYLSSILEKKLFMSEQIYTLPKIEQFIIKNKLDVCYIDYLGLIQHGNNFMKTGDKIGAITMGLKFMAKKYNCCIVLGSQLNRGVEGRIDKRPQLSDLRDSGNIEQDSDVVIMLHREEYYDKETDKKNTIDLLIRKNRNGDTPEITLGSNFSSYRILDNA